MEYYAIYLNENFVGFINEESQKAFLLECDPNHEFYQFTWDKDTPPMPGDINLVNGNLQIIT
jgi:hypothetical protein